MLSLVRNARKLGTIGYDNVNLLKLTAPIMSTPQRSIGMMFEHWFNRTFNQVDESRVKAVGIDRACAEWILRCGGGIQWKGSNKYLRDYNVLPAGGGQKIGAIDMTDSAVMEEAFVFLNSLQELRKITICNSKYIKDDSIGYLCSYTRDKLEWLKIERCNNVTDEGLHHLRVMKKLKYLGLDTLHGVDKQEKMLAELKVALPNCHIEYPPYTTPTPTKEETKP